MNSRSRPVTAGEQASELDAAPLRCPGFFIPAGEPYARAQEGAVAVGELGDRETLLSKSPPRSRWQDKNLGIFFYGVSKFCCISFQGSHKKGPGCECFLVS